MTNTSRSSSTALRALLLALTFQGLSGVVGGFGLVADPSGAALGVPLEWLSGSPFSDYRVPGIVLVTVLGIGPLIVAWGLWTRRSWSVTGAFVTGVALLVWIGVEIAVIGYQAEPPLQLVYGVLGAVIIALSMLPSIRGLFGEWNHEHDRDEPGTIPTA